MMLFIIDGLTVLVPILLTLFLYYIYYKLIIISYVKKIADTISRGESDKANYLIANALKKQPRRMTKLFLKYGIKV